MRVVVGVTVLMTVLVSVSVLSRMHVRMGVGMPVVLVHVRVTGLVTSHVGHDLETSVLHPTRGQHARCFAS